MKLIEYITIAITVVLLAYLLWNYFSAGTAAATTKSVDYSLANNARMNEVPTTTSTGKEGFAIPTGGDVDLAINKLLTVTDATDKATIATRLSTVCGSVKPDVFTGFRSVQSGATFKFEEVKDSTGTSKSPKEYVLHAINGKVVTVDKLTKTLLLAVKNTADIKQIFVARTPSSVVGTTSFTIGTTNFYMEPKDVSDYALQYEYEQLSLRPLAGTGSAFLGQVFTTFTTTDAELEAAALDIGQAVGIDSEDLQPGIRGQVTAGSDTTKSDAVTGTVTKSSSSGDLAALTNAQVKAVIDSIIPQLKAYMTKTGGMAPSTNSYGNKEGELNINVNVDESSNETFQDLAGSTNETQNSVRSMLSAYLQKQQSIELGGIPAVGEQISAAAPKLGDVLLGKIKSCPSFDRSKYLTERQIAQCSGCSPDPYLRGELSKA